MEQIGKYRALEKIGQGATSTVYKGYDDALGRYVAIKAISAESGGDETLRKRFEREAQSAARLAHPHIITVYDFGQEQDKLYMAMELLEGVDLKQAIAENRLPSLDQKLDVMEQICDGLAFAHAHEIVHRDLKPANIRLLADDQVKIMDFGLARHAGSDMTRTGLVMGTPYYMSPEQMRGEHVDTRSDVFSLGCVFYELITGQKPFEAESLHSVLYKVLQSNPKSPKEVVKDLPGVVVQLLDRALAKDRNLRFANGEEFLRAVQEAREAVASGRGDEPLAGLEPPTMLVAPPPAAARPQPKPPAPEAVAPAPTEASRSSTASSVRRTGSAPSFTSSRVGRPLPPRRRSNATLFAGLGAVTVAILIVGALLVGRGGSTPPPQAVASSASGELGALVATEVEIARRRLASGDYEEALRRAERALRFDPRDESAQKVQKDARAIKDRVDEALGGVKTAKSGDAAAAGAALWKLLEVAPDHAATAELLPALDSAYKGRAEEARRLMAAARGSAEKTPAQRLPAFAEGQSLVTAAESSFRAGRFAEAARDFMRARARFEAADRLSH